jgi:Rrf2 family nitric oxide-sensitive transcriptional repressor
MRLTQFTDYGLRALMRLAADSHRSFSTGDIAAEFSISRHHLTKVIRDLADAGFVRTQRGVGGGFRLARPPEEITLGQVVRSLEQRQALVECFRDDGGCCMLTPRCRLKGKLAEAREAFMRALDDTTLAECAYPPVPPQRPANARRLAS